MFDSVEETIQLLHDHDYITEVGLATCLFLAQKLGKAIFLEGEPGVGKTEIAKVLSQALATPLIRLQCYEGLDINQAVYEWNYPRQLLEIQSHREQSTDDIFTEKFLLKRPLLQAIDESHRSAPVLLIDELDRADEEFESFLLELLSDFQVTVPEIGTFKARQIPLVVLTSNNAREMSDALKRRCLHLYIDFPEREQELAIIKLKAPESADKLAAEVVTVVQSLRKLDLKKSPGISETIDWVKALTLLNVQSLDQDLVNETLDTIVKYEGDVRKAQEELKEYVRRARARRGSDVGPAGSPPASDKDLLN